jgi:hypothetical protein
MIRRRSVFTFRQGFVVTCWKRSQGRVGALACVSGVPAGVGSWLAEERGECGDGFEQQGIGAGLLVSGSAGAELGDGVAVLGLGGELAQAGGHGRVDGGAARAGMFSRG